MNGVALAALAAAISWYLMMPHAAARLAPVRPDRGRLNPAGDEAARVSMQTRVVVGVGAAAGLLVLVPGTFGLLAAALIAPACFFGLRLVRKKPDTRALLSQLPTALEFLAVALDSGRPIALAIAAVAAISPPETKRILESVSAHMDLGRTGSEAWQSIRSDPVWGQVATDIARAEHSGTALAGLLRIHAEDARQESRDAAIKAARTVGVKSVIPLMMCFLPAFIVVGVVPIISGLLSDFFG